MKKLCKIINIGYFMTFVSKVSKLTWNFVRDRSLCSETCKSIR